MGIKKVQVGFSSGELSPSMCGRFDDPKYAQGLAKCRNFIVRPQGPVELRPGTQFVRQAKFNDKVCRLIPFTFTIDQTMVLEFGSGYIRFHTMGQTLLGADGQPYEVATPYKEADLFGLHYVQSMDVMTIVHESYPPKELRRYGATDWRLTDISFIPAIGAPANVSVSYSVVVGEGVTIKDEEKTRYSLKYQVTAVKDVDGAERESSASSVASCLGNLYLNNALATITWSAVPGAQRYRVYKNKGGLYSFIGETEELSLTDDNLDADSGITPPRFDSVFTADGAIMSVAVLNGGSGYSQTGAVDSVSLTSDKFAFFHVEDSRGTPNYPDYPVVTAKILDRGGTGTGAVIELVTEKEQEYDSISGENYDTYSWYSNVWVTAVNVISAGEGYSDPYVQFYKDGKAVDWADKIGRTNIVVPLEDRTKVTLKTTGASLSVSDSTGSGASLIPVVSNGSIVSVRVALGGKGYTSPAVTVVDAAGSGASFSCTVGRGGDYPSAVAYFEQRRCFAGTTQNPQTVWMTRSGTETDLSYTIPSKADNRIQFTIAAQEASKIIHLIPLSQLVALTNSTEYKISGGGSPLAPDSIDAKVQANIGASMVQPVVVNSTMVYAAARGSHVRELGYNWQASGFSTGDISIRSEHFFENNPVKDMALAKAPDSIIWCAMSDGSLLGCTYLPEQNICGWHRHDFTNGAVESVTTVVEGQEDIVYLCMRRVIHGSVVRYIERMHERFCPSLDNAYHVDCGGTYEGAETREVSGLSWLEGQKVSIFANGCVLPQQVVTNGKVKLSQPSTKVFIGLPITADFQTLPTAVQLNDGSYGIGHSKNINDAFIRVVKSSGVFVGPDFEHLVEVKQRTSEPYGSPPSWMNKEISVMTYCQWNDSGQICIRQVDPLPLTIVSVAFDLAN